MHEGVPKTEVKGSQEKLCGLHRKKLKDKCLYIQNISYNTFVLYLHSNSFYLLLTPF